MIEWGPAARAAEAKPGERPIRLPPRLEDCLTGSTWPRRSSPADQSDQGEKSSSQNDAGEENPEDGSLAASPWTDCLSGGTIGTVGVTDVGAGEVVGLVGLAAEVGVCARQRGGCARRHRPNAADTRRDNGSDTRCRRRLHRLPSRTRAAEDLGPGVSIRSSHDCLTTRLPRSGSESDCHTDRYPERLRHHGERVGKCLAIADLCPGQERNHGSGPSRGHRLGRCRILESP